MSRGLAEKDSRELKKIVYTYHHIGPEGPIYSERKGVTFWFIGKNSQISSSIPSKNSKVYRIGGNKIKSRRNETGFCISFEEGKQKIYRPEEKLPWME